MGIAWFAMENNKSKGLGFMSLTRLFTDNIGIFKLAGTSSVLLSLFACGSSTPDNQSEIDRGKTLFTEKGCLACHASGDTNGGFSSLAAHQIYDETQLGYYLDDSMPRGNPGNCSGQCATDIAAYMASYHDFPSDPNQGSGVPVGEPFVCDQGTSFGYRALRPLTRDQYQRTVEDQLGVNFDVKATLPPDDVSGSFFNNNNISILSGSYTSYVQTAEEIADWSVNNQNLRPLSNSCNNFNQQCVDDLIDNGMAKLFRRELTNEEKNTYREIANGSQTEGDIREGVKLALGVMLSSPQFIYRHEIGESNSALGNGAYELDDYEMATFLSYSFAGTAPDDTLLNAAKNGQLSTSSQIQSQAKRLLGSSAAEDLLGELVHLWLGTDVLEKFSKDSNVIQNYEQMIPNLKQELSLNFSSAMLDSSGSYADIYTPGYTHVNQDLANHYGLNGVSGSNFQKVNTTERGGLLLNGAWLALRGDNVDASPIRRAVYVRRDMLCQDMPAPPAGVSTGREAATKEHAAELALSTTTNARHWELLTKGDDCQRCHAELINPLGEGLEDYDTVGRYRTRDENNNPVSPVGELFSPFLQLQYFNNSNRDMTSVTFNGGQEFAQVLTDLSIAKACLSQQMMSYSTGVSVGSINDYDRQDILSLPSDERHGYNCDVEDMKQILTDESPRAMLEKLGTLDTIRYRKAWNR